MQANKQATPLHSAPDHTSHVAISLVRHLSNIAHNKLVKRLAVLAIAIGLPITVFALSSAYAADNSTANVPATLSRTSSNPVSEQTTDSTSQISNTSATPTTTINSSSSPNTSTTQPQSNASNNDSTSTSVSVNGQAVPVPTNGSSQQSVGGSSVSISQQSSKTGTGSNQTTDSENIQVNSSSNSTSSSTQ
jgi:cytoskeletal protein RodZ